MRTRTKEEVELFKKLSSLYRENKITTQEYKMWYNTLAISLERNIQSVKDFIKNIK